MVTIYQVNAPKVTIAAPVAEGTFEWMTIKSLHGKHFTLAVAPDFRGKMIPAWKAINPKTAETVTVVALRMAGATVNWGWVATLADGGEIFLAGGAKKMWAHV